MCRKPTRRRSTVAEALRVTCLLVASVLGSAVALAPASARGVSGDIGTISVDQLPPQAQATDKLIYQGGPFPYSKDGIVFGNRERALPPQPRGFYHEYTVPTPGSHNRGARRIVCGGNPPDRPQACYYTGDHYQTFLRILP